MPHTRLSLTKKDDGFTNILEINSENPNPYLDMASGIKLKGYQARFLLQEIFHISIIHEKELEIELSVP